MGEIMVIDQQVAFYHISRREIFTGVILGKEGPNYKITYFDGKGRLVAFVAPKNIIPFDT
jgi:hypothetical protein